ncbi:GNAT family N-acetyltransferase [Brevibacillus invocatus]|uniref:GNAT family N-acetyltransferase n=1 Tax=Brevibacillus invocatus TaxID=173959 RepID=UPI00160694F7|nr:GNAT family N-acetyltransferase [Brevibacillus invocatus]
MQALPLQHLSEADIPDLLALTKAVEWDYHAPELHTLYSLGKIYGHRNEKNQLLSCAGVIQYDGHAVIGLVIVHPSCQGMGLGQALMIRCMEEVLADVPMSPADEEAVIHLDAQATGSCRADFVRARMIARASRMPQRNGTYYGIASQFLG